MNQILYERHQRCCASNIYPNSPMLEKEAAAINKKLQESSLDGFHPSDGLTKKWLRYQRMPNC